MNKYFVKIPYSCSTYGDLSGYVYADSKEEATELADESLINIHESEHNDEDSDNYNYLTEEMIVELNEEDISSEDLPRNYSTPQVTQDLSELPSYYLSELPQL